MMSSKPENPSVPSLGQMLRAARLRWGWSSRVGGFVRMSMESPTLLVVECYPAMLPPSSHPSRREYLMWWESEDDVLGMIPQLRMVTKINRPLQFTVRVED